MQLKLVSLIMVVVVVIVIALTSSILCRYYVVNPFNASCSKLLLFGGFSAILV